MKWRIRRRSIAQRIGLRSLVILIYVIFATSIASPQPHQPSVINDRWPHFSPDGREIAFTSTRDGSPQSYIMKADGSDVKRVSSSTAPVTSVASGWFPNGDLLNVEEEPASLDQQGSLFATTFVRSAPSGGDRRVIFRGLNAQRPQVAPNGTVLVLETARGPFGQGTPIDIARFDVATLSVTTLTLGDGVYVQGAWSPNGMHIAYACGPIGAAELQICVMNGDGSHARVITRGSGSHEWPSWAPDSRRLAFFVYRSIGKSIDADVCTIDVDGTHESILTQHRGIQRNETPSWSPTGRTIAFQTNRLADGMRIAVMNVDGSDVNVLTT
jgi:Tol biopolymer transport system component